MKTTRLPAGLAWLLAVVWLVAACGGGATPTPTTAPAAQPSPTKAAAASPTAATSAATATTGQAASPTAAATAQGTAQAGGQTLQGLIQSLRSATPKSTSQAPQDPLGVVTIKPGDPITIAYALVVAGPDATLGEDSKRGVEIAIDDLGGKLLGHPIQLTGEDTGCSAEGGQAAASKLASNAQIVAIVGTSCSSEARVLAPVIDQAGMVMVSPSNTAPDLTDPAKHVGGYLRTAHNDKVQGAVAAQFAWNYLKVKKAATIHDGSIYAEQLANVFADEFKKLGGQIVAQEAVGPQDTDMRPVLTRIATQQPELIYYPIFTQAGAFITQQAKQVQGLENTKLMGADGLFSADFLKAAGDAAVGMYLSSPDFSAFSSNYQDFLSKYQKKYNQKPTAAFHAHAYDAAMMIFNAIAKVAVQGPDGTLYIPRKALRDALYATKNFPGLTGNLTCNQYGDCADPHIAIYQITSTNAAGWPDSATKKVYPQS
ncbi:branched-chain amino acid ABC transporter substrate-binding protein [Thermorudis peleae]|uniref:branched-chain amino acid ABC transporter substrate-binding protein n=1 Tax=Thermorudis peleae TaxID=1382356 RepID=UPI000690C2CB|nr:branched-chain amino acid ABC transporter substrate-binding protein [Thermorudis peleae]